MIKGKRVRQVFASELSQHRIGTRTLVVFLFYGPPDQRHKKHFEALELTKEPGMSFIVEQVWINYIGSAMLLKADDDETALMLKLKFDTVTFP